VDAEGMALYRQASKFGEAALPQSKGSRGAQVYLNAGLFAHEPRERGTVIDACEETRPKTHGSPRVLADLDGGAELEDQDGATARKFHPFDGLSTDFSVPEPRLDKGSQCSRDWDATELETGTFDQHHRTSLPCGSALVARRP